VKEDREERGSGAEGEGDKMIRYKRWWVEKVGGEVKGDGE